MDEQLSIPLGSTPTDEPCAGVGTEDYDDRSAIECTVFRRMLLRLFPLQPDVAARYVVRHFAHDFGTYRELCIDFQGESGAKYASEVADGLPANWDETAVAELAWYREKRRYFRALAAGELLVAEIPETYRAAEPPGASLDRHRPSSVAIAG